MLEFQASTELSLFLFSSINLQLCAGGFFSCREQTPLRRVIESTEMQDPMPVIKKIFKIFQRA